MFKSWCFILCFSFLSFSCQENKRSNLDDLQRKEDTVVQEVYDFEENENCVYTMVSSKKNGPFTCYYGYTDSVKIKGNYSQDKRTGQWMYFYKNGAKKYIQNYFNDFALGDFYEYDINGIIKSYRFYGPGEDIIYGVDYEKGSPIASLGHTPFYAATKNTSPLHTDDSIIFELKLGSPPGYHSQLFYLEENGISNNKTPLKLDEGTVKGTYQMRFIYEKPGVYIEQFLCEMRATSSDEIKIDTTSFSIEIAP